MDTFFIGLIVTGILLGTTIAGAQSQCIYHQGGWRIFANGAAVVLLTEVFVAIVAVMYFKDVIKR